MHQEDLEAPAKSRAKTAMAEQKNSLYGDLGEDRVEAESRSESLANGKHIWKTGWNLA